MTPQQQGHDGTCAMHAKVGSFMERLEENFGAIKDDLGMVLIALRGNLATGETGLRGAVENLRRDVGEIRGQIDAHSIRLSSLEKIREELEKNAWDTLKGISKWVGWIVAAAASAAFGYEKFIV